MQALAYYVSPEGSDQNPGTLEQPFATLHRARNAAREVRGGIYTDLFWRDPDNAGQHRAQLEKRLDIPERPSVTIVLRGGTHRLTEPLKLNADDAGTKANPVVWRAYENEQPIVTGSITLDGWEQWREGIWRAPLPTHLPELVNRHFTSRELFYRGQRMVRARFPKFEPSNPRRGGFLFPSQTDTLEPYKALGLPEGFDRPYAHPDEGEVNLMCGHGGWCNNIIPIASMDTERLVLEHDPMKLAWAPWAMITHLGTGNRFYIENQLEDVQHPGEWCIRHREGMIYFKPTDGDAFDPSQVELPVLGQLIAMEGTQHHTFAGITFRGCRQLGDNYHRFGNSGYGAMHPQPDWKYCGEAVHVAWSSHITFDRCHIDQVGGNGLYFERKSWWCCVKRCTFAHNGANPIVFIGDRVDHPFSCSVTDCHIHDGGDLLNYVAGVFMGVSDGIRVEHNHIHDMPHHAVNLATNGKGRNFVEYNRIERAAQVNMDIGAINMWMDEPMPEVKADYARSGHVIRYNLIQDIWGAREFTSMDGQTVTNYDHPHGIYLDDYASNCVVSHNIVVNTGQGVLIHNGQHNLVENNIFIDCERMVWFANSASERPGNEPMSTFIVGNDIVRNIYVPKPESGLVTVRYCSSHHVNITKDHVNLWIGRMEGNVYWQREGKALEHRLCFSEFSQMGGGGERPGLHTVDMCELYTPEQMDQLGIERSRVEADPCFTDLSKGDYTLRPESPAWALGFEPIPMDAIGIRPT